MKEANSKTSPATIPPFSPPQPSAEVIPIADVRLPTDSGSVRHATYTVKRPEEEINEFMVECRATILTRCIEKLKEMRDSSFLWCEILLAIASLAIGTSLGALSSEISYTNDPIRWRIFFMGLPFVGIVAVTAFLFTRRNSTQSIAGKAKEILEILPDPNNSK